MITGVSITTRPPVPIALGAVDTATEEGRTFHQSRLTLFGRWVFVVSGIFLVFFGLIHVSHAFALDPGVLFHVLATGVAGLIWVLGSRARMTMTTMHLIDAAGTWVMCACFAMMAVDYAGQMARLGLDGTPALFVSLLATTYTLFTRAIAIPATATRTTWVGAVAMVPLVVATWWVLFAGHRPSTSAALAFVDLLTWQLAAVAVSAVTSRVLFGLRAEIADTRKLGQYTLEEKIGEGGMGVVYRAHHAMLRRPTAIKLLPLDKAGAENLLRFEREVQLTASLTHPNTVAVFDYGRTVEGVFYYAMEYLDGINLDQLVRADGPQPPGRVVRILQQASGALAEAHQIGLVHRDIKPANIILCERGGVPDVAKVVDFGLVKRVRTDDDAMTMAVTMEQTLLGTPLYMSPESISGTAEVGAPSDLYALGAVAYVLLTGTPVFPGRSVVEILAHHLHTPPEPPSQRLGRPIAPELEELVLQCLAKSPDERPTSAQALRDRLGSLQLADRWTDDDAARWWLRYRQQQAALGVLRGAVEDDRSSTDAGLRPL